jgi:fatty-acid peroxygenase
MRLADGNHDPRRWSQPHRFLPQRFQASTVDPFGFVPQGGGDARCGHRCPGDDLATQLMLMALPMLLHEMRHDVLPQDLRLAMHRLPALPRDGFVIRVT